MNAKEKARVLFNKMLSKNPNRQDGISIIDTIQGKQCAVIAVDEILDLDEMHFLDREYWQEVKTEIEKL